MNPIGMVSLLVNPVSIVVQFLVFVIVVVIVFMILQWGAAKLGWTPDPMLRNIIGLILFLVLLLLFLNWTGVWSGFSMH